MLQCFLVYSRKSGIVFKVKITSLKINVVTFLFSWQFLALLEQAEEDET
jgi:hypothetical protein